MGRLKNAEAVAPRESVKDVGDRTTTVWDLIELIRQFSRERDWDQFHHPKDLGVALAIEVGEILEHFRFRTNEEISDHLARVDNRRELGYEIADALWLLLRLADICGIDASDAMKEKLVLAAAKYPVDLVKGNPAKYTAYQQATTEPRPSGVPRRDPPAP